MVDSTILYGSGIIFVAFFIRALTGFGAGLISIPLLALFWELQFVVPMQLLLEVAISVLLLPKVHKDVDYHHVGSLLIGMFAGNMCGAFTLAFGDQELLKGVLAGVVLLFSIYLAMTAKKSVQLKIPYRWGIVFGLCGGFFGGAFGMSGPIVMLYLAHQISDKTRLRATVIALFFFASAWTGVANWWNGLYSRETFRVLLLLMPAFLLGTALGNWAHFQTSEVAFRYAIAAILFSSAMLLIFVGM